MTKRILVILFIIVLMFSAGIKVDAEQLKPKCNNEEVKQITNLEDVDKKWWSLPYNATKYNSSYYATIFNIEEIVGAKPYWREGGDSNYYAIYKTDTTHYLIMTFQQIFLWMDGSFKNTIKGALSKSM